MVSPHVGTGAAGWDARNRASWRRLSMNALRASGSVVSAPTSGISSWIGFVRVVGPPTPAGGCSAGSAAAGAGRGLLAAPDAGAGDVRVDGPAGAAGPPESAA